MALGKVEVLADTLVIGCAVLIMVPPGQFLGPVTKYHSLNSPLRNTSGILIWVGSGRRVPGGYAYCIPGRPESYLAQRW